MKDGGETEVKGGRGVELERRWGGVNVTLAKQI